MGMLPSDHSAAPHTNGNGTHLPDEADMFSASAERAQLLCPHCGFELDESVADSKIDVFGCPACGGAVSLGAESFDSESADEESSSNRGDQDALDAKRIRAVANLRVSAHVGWSYNVIGCAAGVVLAIQCAWNAIIELHRVRTIDRWVCLYVLAFAACVWWAARTFRRARDWRREALTLPEAPKLPEPDFEPLSDGSQYARNLDNIK